MKRRIVVGGMIAALIGAAGYGGMAIAGSGSDREAARTVVAEPITATRKGPVVRKAGAKITTLYVAQPVNPPEDGGTVIGARCPKKFGKAIGGGAATSKGIVISYLSQIPINGDPKDRVYFVGVDDNSTENEANAGAVIEVHCAKGIKVAK
jgi:hypothetical protein